MERMRNFRKNGLLALLGVVVIAGLLLIAFSLSQSDKRQESIVLPSTTPVEPQPQPETPQEEETSFAQVTKDNVRAVLERTIQRPDAYHQSYTVTVGADEAQSARTVELWVSGALLHAEVSDEARTRTLLTDRHTAYIWYNDNTNYLTLTLEEGVDPWALLGIPNYDYLEVLASSTITDADFLVLEDPQVQSIYVCCQNDQVVTNRYWVNLDNGLLYMADVLEESRQVYSIRQVFYEALALEDEAFSNRFILPDGVRPFTEAGKTQQP